MMISNADRAEVEIRKLQDYCLDPTHDEGKHKARLFAAALGMTRGDAADLRDALLQAVQTNKARTGRRDGYGQCYTVDFILDWHNMRAIIRSGWIVEHGSVSP